MSDKEMKLKEAGETPTKQHSIKCPKLFGKQCACDGYHTFDELYEHRQILWIKLCDRLSGQKYIWASTKYSDGTTFGDWFVLGMNDEKGKQITYHLSAKYWNEVCNFANILEKAPEFDGHTSDEVYERISQL